MPHRRRSNTWLAGLFWLASAAHAIPQPRVKTTDHQLQYNRPPNGHVKFYNSENTPQQQQQQQQERLLLQHHHDWGWMVDTTTRTYTQRITTTAQQNHTSPEFQDELPGEANGFNLTAQVEYAPGNDNSTNSTNSSSTSVVTSSAPNNHTVDEEQTIGNAYHPIRIRAILSEGSGFLEEHERLHLMESILSPALLAWSSALRVVPVVGNLTIDPNQLYDNATCGGVPVPPLHFTEGIPETDVILYLKLGFVVPDEALELVPDHAAPPRLPGLVGDRGDNSPHLNWWSDRPPCLDEEAVAAAAYCATDQYDRPTAAMLRLCLDEDFFAPIRTSRHVVTVMHELGHALGFNPQSLAYFRNPDGTPMTPRLSDGSVQEQEVNCTGPNSINITATVPLASRDILQFRTVRGGVRVAEIATPSVRQVARNHFDCQSLPGAELESDDEHCIGSHWERRILRTDLMNALVDEVPFSFRISPLTLALFADSGWYQVDISRAQFSSGWGRHAGCEFVEEPCVDGNNDLSPDNAPFFCNQAVSEQARGTLQELNGCSTDWTRKAVCSLSEYTEDLPMEFQYFNDTLGPRVGGHEPLIDYCPVYTGFANGLCTDPDNGELLRVSEVEEFGLKNSRCVSGRIDNEQAALCLAIACVMKDRSLRIKTGKRTWQKCHYARQQLALDDDDNKAVVICPDPRRICPTFYCRRDCLGTNGVCDYTTGECLCNVTNINGTTMGKCGAIYSDDQVAAQLFHDEVADSASPLSDYYYASPDHLDKDDDRLSPALVIVLISLGSVVGACAVFMLLYKFRQAFLEPLRRLSSRIRQGLLQDDEVDEQEEEDMRNKAFANKDIMIASMLVDMRIHHPQLELGDSGAPTDSFIKDMEASVNGMSVTESEESSSQLDKTSEIESVENAAGEEENVNESSTVTMQDAKGETTLKRATATLVRRRRKNDADT